MKNVKASPILERSMYREGRASTTPVRIMCNTGAAQQKLCTIVRVVEF
jgi:hypothetical protein